MKRGAKLKHRGCFPIESFNTEEAEVTEDEAITSVFLCVL